MYQQRTIGSRFLHLFNHSFKCIVFLVLTFGLSSRRTSQTSYETNLPIVLKNYRHGYGIVTGRVVDASIKSSLPEYYIQDASVCISDFWCIQTDSNGIFTLNRVPTPWQVITASKQGYYSTSKIVNIALDNTVIVNFVLVPEIQVGGNIIKRIVLTWDETPFWQNPNPIPPEPEIWANDLDAHLWLDVPGPPTHIGYFDQGDNNWNYEIGDCTTFPNACLESDFQQGLGPETIAISKLEIAQYSYGVLNYNQYRNGVPNIIQTGARIDVYDERGLVQTFTVPDSGEGNFWYVFTMLSDGTTADLIPVNCITYYTGDPPQCSTIRQMNTPLPAKHLIEERSDLRPIGGKDLSASVGSEWLDHIP